MTPKETIDYLIATYPGIFKNAWDCANHLLFSIGNGCAWKNGEIIEIDTPYIKIDNFESAINKYFDDKQHIMQYRDPIKPNVAMFEVWQMKNDVMTISNHFSNENRYEINVDNQNINFSGYNLIFDIPTDITKEWRNFCYGVLDKLFNSGRDIPIEYKDKLKAIYDMLLEMKTRFIGYDVDIERVDVDDNSVSLHNTLQKIGYQKLPWTTNTGKPNLRTCITFTYYDERYRGFVYWNDGTPFKEMTRKSNIKYCDTVEEFIDYAKRLYNGEKIVNKVRIKIVD